MTITISKEFRDLIFPLTSEELTLLEQSILSYGIRDPLVVWTNGRKKSVLIDGHHRWQIIKKHKITKYPVTKLKFEHKHEVVNWIIENQLARRNCTPEGISYLRGLRYKNEKQNHGGDRKSSPQNEDLKTSVLLAQRYKVSKNTIERDEKYADAVDTIIAVFPTPAKQKEVRHQILTRQINISKKDIIELSSLPKKHILNVLEKGKELWQVRSDYNQSKKTKTLQKTTVSNDDFQFFVGDCLKIAEKHIESESIDFILTDPPYADINCYEKLGQIAQRVLKSSGFCLCYVGILYLPQVIEILNQYLTYYWQLILWNKGSSKESFSSQTFHGRKVDICYKPILIFQKPPFKHPSGFFKDMIEGSGIEKEHHEWQQGEQELYSIIDKFSPIGGTILDPFCGSGTTAAACRENKRRCISIDISSRNIRVAQKRM